MSALASMKLSSLLSPTLLSTSTTVGVDKTLDPEGFVSPGVARWVDRSGGVSVGYPSVTLSVRPPTKASRIYRVTAKLALPTLEAVSGANLAGFTPPAQVAYQNQAIMEFMLHERSTQAERLILLSLVTSLFATTITASDALPSDLTVSPLPAAVADYNAPWG